MTQSQQQQVVLLHGLSRSSRSMNPVEKSLKKANFKTINLNYSSLTQNLTEITNQVSLALINQLDFTRPIHFVGHSLGGIIIRSLFDKHPNWFKVDLGSRCVMIGTPNQGSRVADYLCNHKILKHLSPKVTAQLSPSSLTIHQLPELPIETGIIGGTRDYNVLIPVSWFYQRATNGLPGDGIVELSSTTTKNMADSINLPVHHSFMTWNKELSRQVVSFLQNGKFTNGENSSDE